MGELIQFHTIQQFRRIFLRFPRRLLLATGVPWRGFSVAADASVDRPLSDQALACFPAMALQTWPQPGHGSLHALQRTHIPANDHNADAMSSRRQKYSIYLPLHRPSRATSRATSATKEGARSPKPGDRKSSRTSAAAAAAAAAQSMAKRRSTMNSRDAAYDEEQLRRAIEISQKDTITEEEDGTQIRRPKRIRDDDDE